MRVSHFRSQFDIIYNFYLMHLWAYSFHFYSSPKLTDFRVTNSIFKMSPLLFLMYILLIGPGTQIHKVNHTTGITPCKQNCFLSCILLNIHYVESLK
jgi:hypothetical protein